MNEAVLVSYYKKRGFDETTTRKAIDDVLLLEKRLSENKIALDTLSIDDIREHIKYLIKTNQNSLDSILALARYFYLIERNDIYIYFTSLLGVLDVIENISTRLVNFEGQKKTDAVFADIEKPPIGSEPQDYPDFTQALMKNLEAILPIESVKHVLAGNNHNASKEPFLKEKEIYEKSASLEEYLLDYHKRQVENLQEHCEQNKVWFEQKITQQVVDYVASNQEIQSAVYNKAENALYTTKIPYDPEKYLAETDEKLKRYYGCHCPFAREAILKGNPSISENWCYCSGGFVKHPYEVIFDKELKVDMLQSVLKGDQICRFKIHLD